MSAGRRIPPALQTDVWLQKRDQQTVRGGRVQKVVMEEVVEAVLREAAGVSPSARDSCSEDVTQMASSRRPPGSVAAASATCTKPTQGNLLVELAVHSL